MAGAVSLAAAVLGGGLAGAWAAPLCRALRAARPPVQGGALGDAMGAGLSLGWLGGFRTLTADLCWLRVQDRWERRDYAGTLASLRIVTAIDPGPLLFWLEGARMIAYDVPTWTAATGVAAHPTHGQARLALAWLDRALVFHPGSAPLFIERALIELHALHDPAGAADDFGRAAARPDAPPYAVRLQAEMLRRLGRGEEALARLRIACARLPPGSEDRELILLGIRRLEADRKEAAAARH